LPACRQHGVSPRIEDQPAFRRDFQTGLFFLRQFHGEFRACIRLARHDADFRALRWPWRVFDCAEREQTACLLVWACYTFAILMRIVLDRNARDGKSTKTHRFKNSDTVKAIENIAKNTIFSCEKGGGGR